MRPFATLLTAILLVLPVAGFPAPASPRPPNVVMILADDLGFGDLGCYGQQRIRTPRLDRMAAEGLRFTRCYAGATVCAPSRCVLMLGQHTGHCRVRGNAGRTNPLAQSLRPNDLTIARILQNADYVTGLVGKWGLGDVGEAEVGLPRRHGFDYFYGYLNQTHAHNYYPSFLWRNEQRVPLPNLVTNESTTGAGVSANKAVYSPDLIAEEALDFIRRHRQQRFFLCFTPTYPHANNEAGKHGMEVPDFGPYAKLDWPAPAKGHAAMIDHLDRDVGRLLDLLEELGLSDDTVVFFTSDNGPHREGGNDPTFNRSSGPWRGIKRDLYEGGIRVPMIVRWPGQVPAGKTSDAPWWFADFLPTAAALVAAPVPAGVDGIDVTRLLRGRALLRRHPPMYWEFHEGGFKQAILDGRWKAVRLKPEATPELYDLRSDPGETHDLAARYPRRLNRLAGQLSKMRNDSPDWPVRPTVTPTP